MRILIDVDGVLADFVGGIVGALNHDAECCELAGSHPLPRFTPDMVTSWDIGACLNVEKRLVYGVASEPGFCANLRPVPGAKDAVAALRSLGNVYTVTSPIWSSPHWVYERTAWLRSHFGFEWGNIVHTSAKHIIKADILIDDKPSTINTWCEAGNNGGILWDQPWNRTEQINGIARRIGTWDDLLSEAARIDALGSL